MRQRVKRAAFASGLLSAYHRRRNAPTLTVVTFHRVLGEGDGRWATADPRYTMATGLFRECIAFLRDHYQLVDGPSVAAAGRGHESLPPRALLVTFDDGWADTAECALPMLRKLGCPAVVFVPPTVVGSSHPFWQERVFAAWKLAAVGDAELAHAWASAGEDAPPQSWRDSSSIRALIPRLTGLDPATRAPLVESLAREAPSSRPEMVSLEQLHELRTAGLELGAHGLSHEPLAANPRAAEEIAESRSRLSELLGGEPVTSMSFPHGSYDDPVLGAARREFEIVHTSKATLNPTSNGLLASPVLGRIGIPADAIAGAEGKLRPELLALWLMRRPVAAL